jgi:hypothetical protein
MTQEQKDLLLKDLCARLPYGVKVQDELGRIHKLVIGNNDLIRLYYNDFSTYSEEKLSLPYLFPISSMTEEQKYEFENTIVKDGILTVWTTWTYDWFNKNHFDYRGLIPMGLAEDATGLNIY